MRWRNWWCCAAVGAVAVSGWGVAQVPGGFVAPSGPLPPPSGALPTSPSAPAPLAPAAIPQPTQSADAPTFAPAPAPGPLPPPTVTQIPGSLPFTPQPSASLVAQPPARTPPALDPLPPPAGAGQPALSVKQALPDTVAPGQPVAAEVTVTNVGTKTAENVVLAGWWTPGYDVSDQSVASQVMNGKRAWGMGAIAAGESRVVRVKLVPSTATPPTEFRSGFDATFSSAVTDTRSVKVLKPEVKVAVTAPDQVFVGQPVPVQIKVTNPSAIPVQKVVVQSFVSGSLSHPKIPAGSGGGIASDPTTLMPGGADSIPLDLSAVRGGEGKLTVRVLAEGADPVTTEVMVKAVEARMGVTLHGPKSLYQNWPATFEAVIENQGDHPIRGATFEVKLPPGMTENLRASDKPGYDSASNRLVWKFDTLQPGEKKTVMWFGYSRQAEDLLTTGTATVGGMPLRRAEWTTKNLGAEAK